jgi:hypothetical protein
MWAKLEEISMKTCPYCMKEDLHDKARKCPYCGAWLGKIMILRWVLEIMGWVFLAIFILALGSCALMGAGLFG